MFREILKVFVEDLWYVFGDMVLQLVDNGGHCAEDLWFPGQRQIPLVVQMHSFQQRRYKVVSHLEQRRVMWFEMRFQSVVNFKPPPILHKMRYINVRIN